MNIKELAEQLEPYIVERRREYHQYPETSFNEVETTKRLKRDLEEMGLEPELFQGVTGMTATICGGKPGKTIALRSDIDALLVKEETGLPFASENGSMHACGHDNHMAMLLGAAKILLQVKDELKGNVKLIFQPAEEVAMGAKAAIERGAMDNVDAVAGLHVWGGLEEGKINFQPGNRMAGCDTFQIHIKGFSAHGSEPQNGIDAIAAAANVIMGLQTYVSRRNTPLNPLVITMGTIQGGTRFNTIANKVEIEGTVRTFDRELQKRLPEELRQMAKNAAAVLGATAELDYQYMTPPVLNLDRKLNTIAGNAAVKLFGEAVYKDMEPVMGSEDFSFYGDKAPSIFGFLGTRNEKEGRAFSNHNEKYDMAEKCLKMGSAVMAQLAINYLEEA